MANYTTQAQKFSYANAVISHAKAYGWDAPLRLLREYYGAAYQAQLGRNTGVQAFSPQNFTPSTPISFAPNILGNNAAITASKGNGTLNVCNTNLRSEKGLDTLGHGFGGNVEPLTFDGAVSGPGSDTEQIKKNDIAVYIQTNTVKNVRGNNFAVIPVPISGYDDFQMHTVGPADVDLTIGGSVSGVYVKANVVGTLDESQIGSINCAVPASVTEFDDWIVVTAENWYGREIGQTTARTSIAVASYNQRPRVFEKMSTTGEVTVRSKTINTTDWFDYDYSYLKNFSGLTQLTMPQVLRTGSYVIKNNNNFQFARSSDYIPTVTPIGVNNFNTPWISGYYNRVVLQGSETGEEFAYMYKFGLSYRYRIALSSYTDTVQRYMFPAVDGAPTADLLRSCYNAQQISIININNINLNRSAALGCIIGDALGKTYGADQVNTAWVDLSVFQTQTSPQNYLAFPDFDTLKAFYADWGILATDNVAEAQSGDNASVDPAGEDSPEGNGGWGSWSPDDPGIDGWENPSNGTGDDPAVPYDPDTPGVEPLQPDLPNVSSATGSDSYVLNQIEVKQVTEWLMGEDFLKDASNLFTDKMSAVNSLTLFPFDIVQHDPGHVDKETSLSIAKATLTTVSPYLISSGYNIWIDGGELTFGENWLALRPDFNAFSTSSYTVFVPFVGMVDVPASAVIYRRLTLQYAVDIVNGAATAVLKSFPAGEYNYSGATDAGFIVKLIPCQVGVPVPLVSSNTVQRQWAVTSGAISGAINGFTGAFGGGQSSGRASPGKASGVSDSGFITQKAVGAGAGVAAGVAGAATAIIGAGFGAAKGALDASIANPLEFSHSGSIGSMASWALGFNAYLTVTSQVPAYPANYRYVMGAQTSRRGYLSEFTNSGYNYVECYATKLNVPGATKAELELINQALEQGVFI